MQPLVMAPKARKRLGVMYENGRGLSKEVVRTPCDLDGEGIQFRRKSKKGILRRQYLNRSDLCARIRLRA